MTALFTANEYDTLHRLVFRGDYPGYTPATVELPNGDGYRDDGKRYAHISMKNLTKYKAGWDRSVLLDAFLTAHFHAVDVARALGVPDAFMPRQATSALRVLEYPAGVGSAEHTDFDLFTLNCYRNQPNAGLGGQAVHMGELGEILGLGPATPHHVDPAPTTQRSMVHFAIPDHDVVLPGGVTVGSLIAERIARSRVVTK